MKGYDELESTQDRVKNVKVIKRLTVLIAVFLAASSLLGLLNGRTLYPGDEYYGAFLPNDILNLALSLPALLICLWLMQKGRLAGVLCLPAVLFNSIYMLILNIIGLPLNFMFLPYMLLFSLYLYSMIYILSSINGAAFAKRLEGKIPLKFCGGVILFLGIFNLLFQAGNALTPVWNGSAVAPMEFMLLVADLAFNVPALLLGGILLLKHRPLGYAAAPGLLFQYTLLAVGAIFALLIQAQINAEASNLVDIAVLTCMVLLCCVPLVFILKNAGSFSDGSEV